MKRYIAWLITGALIGAALMNLFLNRQIDNLHISREEIRVELYETSERLKKIEAQQQADSLLVLAVDVQFLPNDVEPLVEIELRKAVLTLAQDLIGTEVEQVPHTLVVHLLDQRIIVVDGTSYRIHVKTMVVAVKVSFILNCELVDVQDGD